MCPVREFECTNTDRGCAAVLRSRDLKAHLEDCEYDWISCPRGQEACGPKYRRALAKIMMRFVINGSAKFLQCALRSVR